MLFVIAFLSVFSYFSLLFYILLLETWHWENRPRRANAWRGREFLQTWYWSWQHYMAKRYIVALINKLEGFLTFRCKALRQELILIISQFVQDFCLWWILILLVVDTNDRYLRQITIGQSPTEKGKTRVVSMRGVNYPHLLHTQKRTTCQQVVLATSL